MKAKQQGVMKAPYVGPRSLRSGERLFGRDREIYELGNRLRANHVVLMHALSGAGKTSMIQAGLVPALQSLDFRVLPVILVSRQPDPADIPDGLTYNRYQLSTLLSLEFERPPDSRLKMAELVDLPFEAYLEQYWLEPADAPGPRKRTLIIFDQFEEILTLNPTDQAEKENFFAWLMPAMYDARLWTLFSMRDDFVGGLEPLLDYFPDRLTSRYRLEFLDETAALDAIQKPVLDFGVTFEDDAAQMLLRELRKISVQTLDGVQEELGPYVEPIQLQVVCLEIWKQLPDDQDEITRNDVEKSGNVDTALGDYYDRVLAQICRDDLRLQRVMRDWIERQLITEEGLRSQSLQRHLARYGMDAVGVEKLIGAYLIRQEQRLNAIWYELAHDRLVSPIKKANQRWRDANLQPWQLTAERWERGGKAPDSDLLLKSDALRELQASFNPSQASPIDLEYLQASEKAIQQARQIEIQRWADPERLRRVELGTNLDETGWGVIFAQDESPDVREALKELLDHRKAQAGQYREVFYREFTGLNGYRPGETYQDFLRRNGTVSGINNPEKMPYYLLLVGDPETIPFDFQYGLDREYAVGRIYFDSLDQYQSYARSVRVCESGTVRLPNHAAVFNPVFPDDRVSGQVMNSFSQPLSEMIQKAHPNWRIDTILAEQATKANLAQYAGGPQTPSVLLFAGWGAGGPNPPANEDDLGALMCVDWPGPGQRQAAQREHYFGADDVNVEIDRLLGLVAIFISAFSAGAPDQSDFSYLMPDDPSIAEARLARLPQVLLGHPYGGALGVIAHVDMIWTSSFEDSRGQSEVSLYLDLVSRIMQGYTIGAAVELLNQRASQISNLLQERLQRSFIYGEKTDRSILENLMTSSLDARNYVLLGDPAARLPVEANQPYQPPGPDWARPEITPVVPLETRPVPSRPVSAAVQTPQRETAWYASGIDPLRGTYLQPPLSASEIVEKIRSENIRAVRRDLGGRRMTKY